MSTFNGFVSEFPQIRIDYFRKLPDKPAPLACFLSHVHSDHLLGLDSLRSPFVYCSPATRNLVLKLEKYPHRMNFAKGILECRKQTYKHLRTLLKTIPLETPTSIELSPGNNLRVTLFDANHCLGAVSFLIEGHGKAVLYTGDVRAEPWWINSLVRHPMVVPYARGIRRLDTLYLDTTHADKAAAYLSFPSKADGIAELLTRVKSFKKGTIFHFHAWTFGYEDAWLALSQTLGSRIHLDTYRYSIYTSISQSAGFGHGSREAAWLCGFPFGNSEQAGILTREADNVLIHSCERGTQCHVFSDDAKVVQIIPIVSRHDGVDMRELGAGGGKGDLDQIHELELTDEAAITQLATISATKLNNPNMTEKIQSLLLSAQKARQERLPLEIPDEWKANEDDAITLPQTLELLANLASKSEEDEEITTSRPQNRIIRFPYSRHSSYSELRTLVKALNPRDVYPCTAPPEPAWDEATMSMKALFGDLFNLNTKFSWDEAMKQTRASRLARLNPRNVSFGEQLSQEEHHSSDSDIQEISPPPPPPNKNIVLNSNTNKRRSSLEILDETLSPENQRRMVNRREAFDAATEGRWHEVELTSVRTTGRRRRRRRHVEIEEEL